jgi:hypothetical protein
MRLKVFGAIRPLCDAKLKKSGALSYMGIEGAPLLTKANFISPPKLSLQLLFNARAGGESALISLPHARRYQNGDLLMQLRFDETDFRWVGLV